MPVQYLLTRAAMPLRRMRLMSARTLSLPLRVRRDGRLRCRGLRLRLYGVGAPDDAALCSARLAALLAGKPCRWRVLAIDGDGTLAVMVRVQGANLALPLLRDGLVGLRGCGTAPLRAAQEAARRERRGIWRFAEERQMPHGAAVVQGFAIFPWWQG
jgi:endonuclease YncB( thermonuclease family)